MINIFVKDFDEWRVATRKLISNKIDYYDVQWLEQDQKSLFDNVEDLPDIGQGMQFNVPKEFISLAQNAACFRDNAKWALLYKVLWRIVYEDRNLIKIFTDNDIHHLRMMEKAIKRDAHKMKAFVRFRTVGDNDYVAWHEPAHLVLDRTAPFFARRFAAMNWAIITPDRSAYWNGESLVFGEGLPRSAAPKNDDMEELWKVFYRNIFNPARIKVKMMKSEMPVKYWHTMPETALIPQMLEEADKRVKKMMELSGMKAEGN